jgi:hypothetical protein
VSLKWDAASGLEPNVSEAHERALFRAALTLTEQACLDLDAEIDLARDLTARVIRAGEKHSQDRERARCATPQAARQAAAGKG